MRVAVVPVHRAPRLGVVLRARVVLQQVQIVLPDKRHQPLGEIELPPRLLLAIEVPPHRERRAIEDVAAHRGIDALPRGRSHAAIVAEP